MKDLVFTTWHSSVFGSIFTGNCTLIKYFAICCDQAIMWLAQSHMIDTIIHNTKVSVIGNDIII